MALPNMFHRRGNTDVVDPEQAGKHDGHHDRHHDRKLDRDHDGIDDRRESPTHEMSNREAPTLDHRTTGPDRDHDGIDDRRESPTVSQPPVAPAVAEPERPAAPATVVQTSRTSFLATLGLIVGVTAALASLTGRLAPVGVALGVIGLFFALSGVLASARRRVNGRGVALLAVLASVAAIVFGILAMNDAASWLDSDVNQVDRLRAWLDDQLPFMDSW